jgi:hypothetical protein
MAASIGRRKCSASCIKLSSVLCVVQQEQRAWRDVFDTIGSVEHCVRQLGRAAEDLSCSEQEHTDHIRSYPPFLHTLHTPAAPTLLASGQ